jgi:hypothetical protein
MKNRLFRAGLMAISMFALIQLNAVPADAADCDVGCHRAGSLCACFPPPSNATSQIAKPAATTVHVASLRDRKQMAGHRDVAVSNHAGLSQMIFIVLSSAVRPI